MMIIMMTYSCYSKMDRASIRVIERPLLGSIILPSIPSKTDLHSLSLLRAAVTSSYQE